jgi:uncharacterized phage-associated protein
MASVYDVAAYILGVRGRMTAMKLQKLVYYCQAWSLVWDEAPLFDESIEAWANGPVVPALYNLHRGEYYVSQLVQGDATSLNTNQIETITEVLSFYGEKTSQWLSDLTHMEAPWLEARKGLSPGQRGSQVISHSSMAEYYGSLY